MRRVTIHCNISNSETLLAFKIMHDFGIPVILSLIGCETARLGSKLVISKLSQHIKTMSSKIFNYKVERVITIREQDEVMVRLILGPIIVKDD